MTEFLAVRATAANGAPLPAGPAVDRLFAAIVALFEERAELRRDVARLRAALRAVLLPEGTG